MKAPSQAVRPDALRSLSDRPWYASYKLDGIRCVIRNGEAFSRTMKPIRNNFIRKQLKGLPDFDGELLLRYKGTPVSINEVSSAVMSVEGKPDFLYWAFDLIDEGKTIQYKDRFATLIEKVESLGHERVHLLDQHMRDTPELPALYAAAENAGYEGLMIRCPYGLYKQGVVTKTEGWLLKVKGAERDEGVVINFVEEMRNTNAQERNELGLAKRSTAKDGKVGKGIAGALTLRWNDRLINVSGMKEDLAREIWMNKKRYIGKIVTFEYQELTIDGVPRFPQFKAFRDPDDL